MAITERQRRVVDSVLSIFETGSLPSVKSYSTVTVLSDGAGISYGKHQSTDRADSLDKILFRYADLGGRHAAEFRPYFDELESDLSSRVDPKSPPEWVRRLMALLKRAAEDDQTMRLAQDQVFDEEYWLPACRQAEAMGLATALSHLVVYDSFVQGGFTGTRKKFPEVPPSQGGDERAWTRAYVMARRGWLASSKNALVRSSVYRADELKRLADTNAWDLPTPVRVRGIEIA